MDHRIVALGEGILPEQRGDRPVLHVLQGVVGQVMADDDDFPGFSPL